MTIWLPEDMHTQLRVRAAQNRGTTMTGLIIEALERTYPHDA